MLADGSWYGLWAPAAGFASATSAVANANRTPDFASDEPFRYALGLQYDWSNAVTLGIAYEFLNSKSAPTSVERVIDNPKLRMGAKGRRLRAPFTAHARLRTVLPLVGAVLGMGLFTALIAYRGVGHVAAAFASTGGGVAIVTLFHTVPLLANALGWRSLLRQRVPVLTVVWLRWIAESMNDLLPVLQVGGNVVRARLVTRAGVAGVTAGASVIVDMTLNVFTQVLFTFFGACILLLQVERGGLVGPVILGMTLMGGMVAGFYAVQRRGLFGGMARLISPLVRSPEWTALVPSAAALDAEVQQLYGQRGAIAAASAWHLLSWLLGAGDIWLALYFLGHPVSVSTALLWESVGQAVRTAAFVIPAGLGVQEGCYVVLGNLYGLPPEISLVVSLIRRAREVLLGVPGLVAWQVRGATAVFGARVEARGGRR